MEKLLGVFVNTGLILAGGVIGLLFRKGIPERVSKAIMMAVGLCVVYIGIDGTLEGNNPVVLIVSMVLGTLVGTLIDIDRWIGRLGTFIERKMKKDGDGRSTVAEGFLTASLLFCVGAMAIIGSFNAGLSGDNSILYTKSILDGISACMLASTLGVGVLFSAGMVLLYQGSLALLAGLLQHVLSNQALIAEITCAGSLMILALGLNLLGLTKIKVANLLPAILFVPLVWWLCSFLPM